MKRLVAILIPILAVSGATAQKVTVEYDKTEDVRQHVTWAWHPETAPPPPNVRMDPGLLDQIVRSSVEEKIIGMGYRKVVVEEADFLITYMLTQRMEMDKSSYDAGNSPWVNGTYGHWRPFFEGESATSVLQKGVLIVDFVDAEDRTLFWRGLAEQPLKNKPPSEKEARKIVDKAVGKMLKRYPKYKG